MQRILVVEDDFDIQELLQNFLQEAGYEVAVANDGVEALSLFAGQRYDLIVLDIMLPKIDGYGVCELIRKQSDVPIIITMGAVAAATAPEITEEMYEQLDYLEKHPEENYYENEENFSQYDQGD